jgi:hypothetical protein
MILGESLFAALFGDRCLPHRPIPPNEDLPHKGVLQTARTQVRPPPVHMASTHMRERPRYLVRYQRAQWVLVLCVLQHIVARTSGTGVSWGPVRFPIIGHPPLR